MFNLEKLFIEQEKLDKEILKLHNVTYETTKGRRFLAFLVELGELANATRSFKFRSLKPAEEKCRIVDEFADGLHFILSLGLSFNYRFNEIEEINTCSNINEQFLYVYSLLDSFRISEDYEDYISLFKEFLGLSTLLNLTKEDVMNGYISKLNVNYERQNNKY
ncbi:MAG: dUTP diphosphatase [Bacilli bacterium]